MRYEISHATIYRYSEPATMCTNLAHLTMRNRPGQVVHTSEVVIEPAPTDRRNGVDSFGNGTTYFTIEEPHDELTVTARSVVDLDGGEIPTSAQQPWEAARDAVLDPIDERPFALPSALVPELAHLGVLGESVFTPGRSLAEATAALTSRIHEEFLYDPTATTAATPLADAVAARRGVCQDFAHVAVGAMRMVGLPARYVSGYLETIPPPGVEKLVGADASHAWASVRCPDGTWLDLDPTNDVIAPSTHATVAWGRDYDDVVPVKGVLLSAGGSTQLVVQVDVARVEDPSSMPRPSATGGPAAPA